MTAQDCVATKMVNFLVLFWMMTMSGIIIIFNRYIKQTFTAPLLRRLIMKPFHQT